MAVVVEYVADLVKVPAADVEKYMLVGRPAEYHRQQVREALWADGWTSSPWPCDVPTGPRTGVVRTTRPTP
ncbi:hypothetical protein ACO0M4_34235 [Streptomyces sp. RGM 3693]|uniref:hypothetical protein n=1 Tax=Streptomyces sp. RGM 3693 TaxID=3413284 RepID=UPI003D2CCC70